MGNLCFINTTGLFHNFQNVYSEIRHKTKGPPCEIPKLGLGFGIRIEDWNQDLGMELEIEIGIGNQDRGFKLSIGIGKKAQIGPFLKKK